jgi:lipopolysaccharide assembly outer membrane protein LptD (OstA)
MTKPRHILTLAFLTFAISLSASTQQQTAWEIEALTPEGQVEYNLTNGVATCTNGVLVKYGEAVLTADRVSVNQQSGEVVADGHVRIQHEAQIWVGEHILYNLKTRQMEAEQFRTGKAPVFATGKVLRGDTTNGVYIAQNAYVTSDDIAAPFEKIRAKRLKIVPGKYFEAYNATLYLGGVPVFYFPYYSRKLGERVNNFTFVPGYRSLYGPFLLGNYNWFLNDQLDGALHLDYRERRGVGLGPDFNANLGRWGDVSLKYYYLRDLAPDIDDGGLSIPENRQRFNFSYQAAPITNLDVKALVRYQSDPLLLHDFFESTYHENPQPNTYLEVNKLEQNFSLDVYAQPRVNDFLETVERLPEVKLTGLLQQIGATPLFYESQSSVGYYNHLFAVTNSFFVNTNGPVPPNYSSARADTYHQIILPETLFGWLNITPRVGGRLTWYNEATNFVGGTRELYRGVFNTGAEVSFKASRLWSSATNGLLALDGLRHIIEPSVNYVFVPSPNYAPSQLPQFDTELPSLRLLPIDYPDYNAIDSVDSQNVLRFGLHNKLQTKRAGQVENLLDWDVYTDWRLRPSAGQTTFADLYSDLAFKPRSWIKFESETRYDIADGQWRMALHNLTLQPNDVWNWSIGHFYLRDDFSSSPTALGAGNNLIMSSMFYRLNENWGFRATHNFEARNGQMQEQAYTVYRDLRSWTAALTFRESDNLTGPKDYTVAFTFSLKAHPRFGLGGDAVQPSYLLGN